MPLATRDGALVAEVMQGDARAPTRRTTRHSSSRRTAVVRRLMGYGRFNGVETACVMASLYAAVRSYIFFQPSFNLKEKRREGVKVIDAIMPSRRRVTGC
jgi:hypothetical protein